MCAVPEWIEAWVTCGDLLLMVNLWKWSGLGLALIARFLLTELSECV